MTQSLQTLSSMQTTFVPPNPRAFHMKDERGAKHPNRIPWHLTRSSIQLRRRCSSGVRVFGPGESHRHGRVWAMQKKNWARSRGR